MDALVDLLKGVPPLYHIARIAWLWPTGPFLILAPVVLVALVFGAPRRLASAWPRQAAQWTGLVVALAGLPWLAAAGVSLAFPSTFSHLEGAVTAAIAHTANGGAIYPDADAAARYGLVYGPYTYLLPVPGLVLFGPHLAVLKAVALAALGGGLALAGLVLRRCGVGRGVTWLMLGGAVTYLGLYRHAAFAVKPDAFVFLFAALATYGASLRSPRRAAAVIGLAAAVLLNLKAHTVLAAAGPCIFALLAARGKAAFVAIALGVGAALTLAPFALFGVSPVAYGKSLVAVATHPLHATTAGYNAAAALGLVLPLVGLWAVRAPRPDTAGRWAAGAAAGALALYMIPASKWGASPAHLIAFVPVALWLAGRLWTAPRRARSLPQATAVAAILCLAALMSLPNYARVTRDLWARYANWSVEARVADALQRATVRYAAGGVHVGPGADLDAAVYRQRARPVLSGQPYMLDATAVMDMALSGRPLPSATYRALAGCRIRTWLFAAGEAPFSAGSFYGGSALFEQAFVREFTATYERVASGPWLDVWRCTPEP